MPVNNTFASAQDFYFEDFTADYYLTKLEDGTSNLHVKEVLTAVFPEASQNHGIYRNIPFTNQGGKNRTIANKAALNLTVLRNDEAENVSKIEIEDDYFVVYIGDANKYVNGKQVYTLEYDYTDVITEFTSAGVNVSGQEDLVKAFQELYWDTNGTVWRQRFDNLTARLHMSEGIYGNVIGEAECYVGSYGEKGQDRCNIITLNDGFQFNTSDLKIGENLTFVVDFKPDTFAVVLEKSYVLVIILIGLILFFGFISWKRYAKWKKDAKPQYDLYKSLFVTPQYLPPEDKNICVAEGEQIYIKKTESSYVATLLELAVSKKVTIKKVDGKWKYDWSVTLNVTPEELTGSQKEMMCILAGGKMMEKFDEYPIQKHKATRQLANCARSYVLIAETTLKRNGYVRFEKNDSDSATWPWVLIFMILIGGLLVFDKLSDYGNLLIPSENAIIVGGYSLFFVICATFILGSVLIYAINKKISKYKRYTDRGIELVKYLEGLELYINMAEKDRLKFLQSVNGVDTSNAGIVKLYEKLLPWAALFGAEKSWIKELEKYYEIGEVEEVMDSNVLNGIIAANIASDLNRSIASSTSYRESSSGGGSSSFSSGGGGGGFSGGGGGGGGGGGW